MILLLQILNEISACMVAADRPTVLSTVQRRCKKVDIKDFKKTKNVAKINTFVNVAQKRYMYYVQRTCLMHKVLTYKITLITKQNFAVITSVISDC